MKIFWLSPTPSWPMNAGNRAHIHNFGEKLLKDGHDIYFVLYNQENASGEDIERMRSFWPHFFVIPHRLKYRTKSLGSIWGIDDWFNKDLEDGVKFLLNQENFDAVICEYVFMSKVFTFAPDKAIKILDTHDRMSGRHEMLAQMGISPDFFYTNEEQESIALQRADIILAIQEEEKNFFQRLTCSRVMEIGYQSPFEPVLSKAEKDKLRVGIFASANSLNRKSVRAFLDELHRYPDVASRTKVVMAGRIGDYFSDEIDLNMGYVENEKDFYERIDVAINPMIGGTGLKIKTVSAMQHDCPLLSTTSGSSGLNARHPEHLCASPADLVPFIRSILNSDCQETALDQLRNATRELAAAYGKRQAELYSRFVKVCENMKKSVLLVTDIPFWEGGIGNRTLIMQRCRELLRHFRLRVFFFGSFYRERQNAIREAGLEGKIISFKEYGQNGNIDKSSFVPESLHPELRKKAVNQYYMSLKAFLDAHGQFDAILIEYIWNAYLLKACPCRCLSILDTHDLMAYRKYIFSDKFGCLNISLKDEFSVYNKFDAVVFVQKEEFEKAKCMDDKIIPIYAPVAVEAETAASPAKGVNFGYIGANNTVNQEALEWFLENVWPLQTSPEAKLHIFGDIGNHFTAVPANVKIHGIKKNITDVYAQCDVMINPVIHGSGIKIKSVEALGFGKPLLASPEGARGIEEPEKSGVIVASSRSEFISGMLRLTFDKILRENMASSAREASMRQFSAKNAYRQLIKLISEY